jgi:hypothetical protein
MAVTISRIALIHGGAPGCDGRPWSPTVRVADSAEYVKLDSKDVGFGRFLGAPRQISRCVGLHMLREWRNEQVAQGLNKTKRQCINATSMLDGCGSQFGKQITTIFGDADPHTTRTRGVDDVYHTSQPLQVDRARAPNEDAKNLFEDAEVCDKAKKRRVSRSEQVRVLLMWLNRFVVVTRSASCDPHLRYGNYRRYGRSRYSDMLNTGRN